MLSFLSSSFFVLRLRISMPSSACLCKLVELKFQAVNVSSSLLSTLSYQSCFTMLLLSKDNLQAILEPDSSRLINSHAYPMLLRVQLVPFRAAALPLLM